jgi:hypothetical protein
VVSRRQLAGSEGAVLQIQQWGSLVLYVTQRGGTHAWDLRTKGDVWVALLLLPLLPLLLRPPHNPGSAPCALRLAL